MEKLELAQSIFGHLPYEPNDQQIKLIAALARYCAGPEADTPQPFSSERVFILNGYAGTGKTTVVGALVKALGERNVPVVLMAPTGRAAKVLAAACRHTAFTIHRRIYRGDAGFTSLQENRLTDAVFIVDEASMISNDNSEGVNLLWDLIHYVFSGINCRLIFVGDSAQLPPVGYIESPALSPEVLRSLGLHTTRVVITEPARQKRQSGILYNATRQRIAMKQEPMPLPVIYASPFPDIRIIESPEDLGDEVMADYRSAPDGMAETILIARSNRRATEFNAAVRRFILGYEEELAVGERLMIVKNNYMWGVRRKGLDFIANGDVAVVERVIGIESRYGLRFADVELSMPDRGDEFEAKIILNTLTGYSASLDPELQREFENRIFNDPDLFTSSMSMDQRRRALKSNPYYNALRVKYAYCVTCHKAQGGQWRNVYVDTGYIPPEASGLELYRWLYTATTRATRRLNFIAPPFKIV